MANSTRTYITSALRAFGHFWWDFLVGDTPELFVGGIVVLGVGALLTKEVSPTAAWVSVPVLVIIVLVTSVRRGTK